MGRGEGHGEGSGQGKGQKGGFYSSGPRVYVAPVYYGRYRRTYGYGSYGAATGDCACGCGPLHFLCCFAIIWLIIMMSLTFSTAPKARATDEVYLEMSETRPYELKGSAAFVSSKHDVYDKIGNTVFYQVQSLPPIGPPVLQPVPIPIRNIPTDDWRWEGYWLNPGSTAVYSARCTARVDFGVIEGDSNLASWESNLGGSSYTNYYNYGLTSISHSYGPAPFAGNVYWTLQNSYFGSSTSCVISLNITYTTYSVSGLTPKLVGSGTLDASDGIVIMVPPTVPDPRNVYVGPNDFTVGADMYTITLKQRLADAAQPGAMMGIFAAVCVLFICLGVVMINGLPACLGGSADDGKRSDQIPGIGPDPNAPPASTTTPAANTTAPNTTSPAPNAAAAAPVIPAMQPMQPMQPMMGQPMQYQSQMIMAAPNYAPPPHGAPSGQPMMVDQYGQPVMFAQPVQNMQPMPMTAEGQPNHPLPN